MESQPYIFKKQIITVCFLSLTFIILKLFKNNIFTEIVFYYCLVAISITFVPRLRKTNKYPIFLHTILYYSALYIPVCVINISITNMKNSIGILAGMIIGILLILTNYNHNKKYISSKNYMIFNRINFNELIYNLFNYVYGLIGEELFYRYFFIGFLYKHIGIYAVLLSTIVFVYSHFINRW